MQQHDQGQRLRGIEVRWPNHPNITSACIDVLGFSGDGDAEGHQDDGEKDHSRDDSPTSGSSRIWQRRTPEDSNHAIKSTVNDSRRIQLESDLRNHPVQ